jgi:hypothetical protein
MRHWPALVLVALVTSAAIAPSGVAGNARPGFQTKKQAEVNVLRVVAHGWKKWHRFGLVDRKTHLITDNTEAVCRGRGKRRTGDRYQRYVCVVRPHVHRGRQGLWLKYHALARGHFKVRVVGYRRR